MEILKKEKVETTRYTYYVCPYCNKRYSYRCEAVECKCRCNHIESKFIIDESIDFDQVRISIKKKCANCGVSVSKEKEVVPRRMSQEVLEQIYNEVYD